MKKLIQYSLFVLVLSIALNACQKEIIQPVINPVTLNFRFEAALGDIPMTYGTIGKTENNVDYFVTKFRFYLSNARVINNNGDTINVTLTDTAGKDLKYNVALINFDNEMKTSIKFNVLPGTYKEFLFDMGVPKNLNHVDASTMDYPLNPDADMYWAWDPGYIFMKLEGKSKVNNKMEVFLFHAGFDSNLVKMSVKDIFTVGANGSSFKIKTNLNKFFINIKGENFPDLSKEENRFANGGFPTDYMLRQAEFNKAFTF